MKLEIAEVDQTLDGRWYCVGQAKLPGGPGCFIQHRSTGGSAATAVAAFEREVRPLYVDAIREQLERLMKLEAQLRAELAEAD